MLKKLLLTTAAFSMLSSLAFAGNEGRFYGGVKAGINLLNKNDLLIDDVDSSNKLSFKRDGVGFMAGLEAGYYITDCIRIAVGVDHMFKPKWKVNKLTDAQVTAAEAKTRADIIEETEDAASGTEAATINAFFTTPTSGVTFGGDGSTAKVTAKAKSTSVMLKGYWDMFHYDMFSFYVGAGAGVAFVSGESTVAITGNKIVGTGTAAVTTPYSASETVEFKRATNFAWMVALGASAEVMDDVYVDAEVNYMHHGKPGKANKVINSATADGKTYTKSNNVEATEKVDFDVKGIGFSLGLRMVM